MESEPNQALISLGLGESPLRPLTLREAIVRGFSIIWKPIPGGWLADRSRGPFIISNWQFVLFLGLFLLGLEGGASLTILGGKSGGKSVLISSLTKKFFVAACNEAWMLVERFWFPRRIEFSGTVFISKSCAGAANSASLFMPCASSSTFQCRWRLFCMLKALEPVSMWASIVHSKPPLPTTSCQAHSSWGRSEIDSLNLKTFFSSSTSKRCMRSAHTEFGVHSISTDSVNLMLSGRLDRA